MKDLPAPAAPAEDSETGTPLVTVVMPVFNELAHIEQSLGAVLAQDYPASRLEVLVVDGASEDGTADVARRLLAARADLARGEVIPNAQRTAATGMNLGIRAARGDVVVRMDGHAVADRNYVRRCVEVLRATGFECIGGRVDTVPSDALSRAISVAQSSRFGVGNVAWRTGRDAGAFVDSVPFGAWPRRVFEEVGLFDEELVRNQDDEFTFRLTQAGGRVWYEPGIVARYFSRSSFPRLWRQYYEYGLYKVRVMQKRGAVAAGRHLVPAAFVAAVMAGAVGTVVTRRPRWFLGVGAPYATINAVTSILDARRHGVRTRDLMRAFGTLHVAYGSGTLVGLWRWRDGFGAGREALTPPPRL